MRILALILALLSSPASANTVSCQWYGDSQYVCTDGTICYRYGEQWVCYKN